VLGDIEKGNGDKSLVMFGRNVTPNQHELAEEFVLLDNFYATGGNSADGHQWLTQANEVDYCMWPGYAGRSYPYDGTDPIAYSKNGFLWDYALGRGKTVRVYGEYAGSLAVPLAERQKLLQRWQAGDHFAHDWDTKAPIAPLNHILAKNFPAWSANIPDVARARIFMDDLKGMEAARSMPNLMLLQLPSNHTNGTTGGSSTPQAMVADNDLALGQVVEALTKSRFWSKMAILVVEERCGPCGRSPNCGAGDQPVCPARIGGFDVLFDAKHGQDDRVDAGVADDVDLRSDRGGHAGELSGESGCHAV
jgi:hypothetical protein